MVSNTQSFLSGFFGAAAEKFKAEEEAERTADLEKDKFQRQMLLLETKLEKEDSLRKAKEAEKEKKESTLNNTKAQTLSAYDAGLLDTNTLARRWQELGGDSRALSTHLSNRTKFDPKFAARLAADRVAAAQEAGFSETTSQAFGIGGTAASGAAALATQPTKSFNTEAQKALVIAMNTRSNAREVAKIVRENPEAVTLLGKAKRTIGDLGAQTQWSDWVTKNLLGISAEDRVTMQRLRTALVLLTGQGVKDVLKEQRISDADRKFANQAFSGLDLLSDSTSVLAALGQLDRSLVGASQTYFNILEEKDFENSVLNIFPEIRKEKGTAKFKQTKFTDEEIAKKQKRLLELKLKQQR
jgi:hypothetical protein